MPKRYEHILFRYSSALERGDFETVADVLREAERDPALEAMLLELNEVYAAEPTGRTNHRNPKELTMIAPLYQKRAPERVRTYNLPMVAALAVVALLGVLLATRISPPTQWNTAQNGSPEPNMMQGVPDECAPSDGVDPARIQLYSRPSAASRYAYDAFSMIYIPQENISQLDAVEAEGQTWYFVRISDLFREDMQGWMTAAEYNRNVQCAPLLNPDVQPQIAEASAMPPTVVPPDTLGVMTATPMPFDGSMPTMVPPDGQGLATFTATPAPFDGSMPTVVPTSTPFPLNGDAPPLLDVPEEVPFVPTVVPFAGEPTSIPPTPTLDPLAVAANFPAGYGCTIETENVVNIQDQPSNAAPVREQLPADTPLAILAISKQDEGDWYLVNYRTRMGSLTFGVIAAHLLDVPEDCNYFGADGEMIAGADVQTATPMPTALPPSATPTPAR